MYYPPEANLPWCYSPYPQMMDLGQSPSRYNAPQHMVHGSGMAAPFPAAPQFPQNGEALPAVKADGAVGALGAVGAVGAALGPKAEGAAAGVAAPPFSPPLQPGPPPAQQPNGIEQQTVSITAGLQQTEPEGQVTGTTTGVVTAVSVGAGPECAGAGPGATPTGALVAVGPSVLAVTDKTITQPKRLHVSNIPFRFRDPDLRTMFGQYGSILDVEIIFNERGSKGFGFVTFANSGDAERARERLHGTVVEGRKIEVNNATARVQTKKPTAVPNVCVQWPEALRGVAVQRGRHVPLGRSIAAGALAYPASPGAAPSPAAPVTPATAAAAYARPTAQLAAALHPYPHVYYDPYHLAAATDTNFRIQAAKPVVEAAAAVAANTPLLKAPMASNPGLAANFAVARAYSAAAAAQPVTGYAAVAGYGREYADPYLSHGIGPVAGYGATVYRSGYNRFAPY